MARIFNTYGPRMHPNDGRVVSNFIVQALKGEDITLYGDGAQTRSFCYVDDLVEGLIRLMDTGDEVTGPINLGNPVEFTMKQLAELVLELTGSRSAIVHRPLPSDDPRQRQPDITLAKQVLDWTPTAPLKVGLMAWIAESCARWSSPANMNAGCLPKPCRLRCTRAIGASGSARGGFASPGTARRNFGN